MSEDTLGAENIRETEDKFGTEDITFLEAEDIFGAEGIPEAEDIRGTEDILRHTRS